MPLTSSLLFPFYIKTRQTSKENIRVRVEKVRASVLVERRKAMFIPHYSFFSPRAPTSVCFEITSKIRTGGIEMNSSITSEAINNFNLSGQHKFFKRAGNANSFYELNINDLAEERTLRTLSSMYKNDVPFIVFGKTTNLFITEQGYNGFFVKLNSKNKYMNYNEKSKEFIVSASTHLSELVNKAVLLGYDFSDLAGIPGLIGSAVVGNAGTHLTNKTIGELVKKIQVYNFESGKYETIVPTEYKDFFSERNSFLKNANEKKMKYLVFCVVLQADYIGESIAIARKTEVLRLRRDSDVEGFREGTAG